MSMVQGFLDINQTFDSGLLLSYKLVAVFRGIRLLLPMAGRPWKMVKKSGNMPTI